MANLASLQFNCIYDFCEEKRGYGHYYLRYHPFALKKNDFVDHMA